MFATTSLCVTTFVCLFVKVYFYFSLCNGFSFFCVAGSRGDAVDSGIVLQAGSLRVRIPKVSLEFFIDRIVPAEPLRELGTRNISWAEVCKGADA
jgi:hypothetical protein